MEETTVSRINTIVGPWGRGQHRLHEEYFVRTNDVCQETGTTVKAARAMKIAATQRRTRDYTLVSAVRVAKIVTSTSVARTKGICAGVTRREL